jgi:hypothetical protein
LDHEKKKEEGSSSIVQQYLNLDTPAKQEVTPKADDT